MIKVISLLKRKPEMTHDEFVRYWVDVHAPMGYAVPGVVRYSLSKISGTLGRSDVPDIDVDCDGVAEAWFDDLESMRACHASPEAKTWFADGASFIGESKTWTIEEQVVIPRPVSQAT